MLSGDAGNALLDLALSENAVSLVGVASSSPDNNSPRIVGVTVGASSWSDPFVEGFRTNSLGEGGYRIPIGSADRQLAPLPWVGLDKIAIDFDKPVQLRSNDLRLDGINSNPPSVTNFYMESNSTRAIWIFEQALRTDDFLIEFSDAVTDLAGNRLDGEWSADRNQESGNGVAGGQFKFRFRVQIGDSNQDGQTSVEDFALTAAAIDRVLGDEEYDVLSDIDGDASVSSADIALIAQAFGDNQPRGGHWRHLQVRAVGDIDGSGSPELAALVFDGVANMPRLLLIDAMSGLTLQQMADSGRGPSGCADPAPTGSFSTSEPS